EAVGDLSHKLEKLGLAKRTHAHWRNWFRGHSRTGWQLEPGVYRGDFGSYLNEQDRLTTEQHLNQEFRIMSAGLRTGQESDEEIYFLQQYYRMPTRLLDWTTSALAALYFACCKNSDSDGELFIIDAYQFVPQAGIATSRHPEFRNAIQVISRWRRE